MAVTSKATIDTNTLGATGAELELTTETLITLYVIEKTGTHELHRVAIEYSPDGVNWFASQHSLNGHGHFMTEQVIATNVRACVCRAEGSVSTAEVVLLAR